MSKCLKCGAALPPVGECPACAAAASPLAPPAVPGLLAKDIQIDRRAPERTAADAAPPVPGFAELGLGPATPPGLVPLRPPPPPASTAPRAAPPRQEGAARAAQPPVAEAAPRMPPPAAAPGPAPRSFPTPVPVTNFPPPLRVVPPPSPEELAPEAPTPSVPLPVFFAEESAPAPSAAPGPSAALEASPRPPAPARPRAPMAPPRAAPEVQEVHARPAALWRRLLSFTIDTAALLGVAALYITLASSIAGGPPPSSEGLTALDALAAWMHALRSVLLPGCFLLLVLATAYCAVAAYLWNGRTLGRWLLGLRLVDTHGLAPAPGRAIVRALLSVVSFGLFLGGFWMALFDRRGQTLHDKLTSTFVVQPS